MKNSFKLACELYNPRQHHKATKHTNKFGFVVATHRNNVGRDDLGTPWQESQCSKFAQRLEGAQILVYVDLWVNLLYNPTIAKMAR